MTTDEWAIIRKFYNKTLNYIMINKDIGLYYCNEQIEGTKDLGNSIRFYFDYHDSMIISDRDDFEYVKGFLSKFRKIRITKEDLGGFEFDK